jgi:hypothetical protein
MQLYWHRQLRQNMAPMLCHPVIDMGSIDDILVIGAALTTGHQIRYKLTVTVSI